MRVLAVVPDLQVGGTERYAARVAVALRRHGIEVEICALDHRGPLVAELEAAGIRTHGTSFSRWTSRAATGVLVTTAREIADLARSGRFDAIHSYLYWADVLGAAGGRLARRRVVVSRRALHRWRHEPRGWLHLLEMGSNVAADELVANSKAVLADTERCERFLPAKRGVVYNGVEVETHAAAKVRKSAELRVVTLGSLSPLKGQDVAVRAIAMAVEGGVDARLSLVGGGPDRKTLEQLACELGIAERVVFAGEQADPRPYLAGADLFLLPSRTEGFSNALLEAMASSLPVLATDVGGNPEAVVDGEGGRLVPPERAELMAKALVELDGDRERLAAMGRANRSRAGELFSIEASARALADWYLGR
jgi:L-malate glycosyltransferase